MFQLLVTTYNDNCIKNKLLKFNDITSADIAYRRIQEKGFLMNLKYAVIKLY